MRHLFIIFCFAFAPSAFAQYSGSGNTQIQYEITKVYGNENILNTAGNISAAFRFDSIGSNWNLPTENDFIRFKILHFYIIGGRKEGERWKELYAEEKNSCEEVFNRYMDGKLKRSPFKISTTFQNTAFSFLMIFFDASVNVQKQDYRAVCRLIDNKNGKCVLEYNIKVKDNYLFAFKDQSSQGSIATFSGLCTGMANYFKKEL